MVNTVGSNMSAQREKEAPTRTSEVSQDSHDHPSRGEPLSVPDNASVLGQANNAIEEDHHDDYIHPVVVSDHERKNRHNGAAPRIQPQETDAAAANNTDPTPIPGAEVRNAHSSLNAPSAAIIDRYRYVSINNTNAATAIPVLPLYPPHTMDHAVWDHHGPMPVGVDDDLFDPHRHHHHQHHDMAVLPQPWMMAASPPQHLFYQQQQQQIDHAVAYANAAAHVAWAAAQAVQHAVLHQQQATMLPPPHYPPPQHQQQQLLMGVPPLLATPPSWMGHHVPPPPPSGSMPVHYYNNNMVPPQYGRRDTMNLDLNERDTAASLWDSAASTAMYHHHHHHEREPTGWYPRKRQQRVSAIESNGDDEPQPKSLSSPSPAPPTRDKIRRRLRSSDNESSSSGGYYHHHQSKQNQNDGSVKGSNQIKTNHHSGGGRGHGSGHSMNKKARSTNDEALIGKTGVAALFQWCSKRHCTPTFTIQKLIPSPPSAVLDEEFECIVFLEPPIANTCAQHDKKPAAVDDSNCEEGFLHEWGRGYGRNKNAAKQDSARRAMQALIPGVRFDDETGILIRVPALSINTESPSCVGHPSNAADFWDDLAPNLAKRLEISCDDPTDRSDAVPQTTDNIAHGIAIKHKPVIQQKRTLGTYPETSTTSEDEDRSTYYASRGASVCSVLLHTIIQIDKKRIPDMPTFSYELCTSVSAGNIFSPKGLDSNKDKEVKANSSSRVMANNSTESTSTMKQTVARCSSGPFQCTAQLKILSASAGCKPETEKVEDKPSDEGSNTENEISEEKMIEAVGMGGTKRDARHVASAKLLSLLFPECNNDMAKVKAAAELMRDRYAASRVQKHHTHLGHRNGCLDTGERLDHEVVTPDDPAGSKTVASANFIFAQPTTDDPPLPSYLNDFLADLCSNDASVEPETCDTNSYETFDGASDSLSNRSHDVHLSAAAVFRQLGRQKQMDYCVDSALQRFNELDDEGRLICGGGNEDDVGRTILRRAEPSDLPRIRKLMRSKWNEKQVYDNKTRDNYSRRNSGDPNKGRSRQQVSELSSTLADVTINGEVDNQTKNRLQVQHPAAVSVSQFWSSTSSTVLLLCRAISAYEDPPLGCAYLSFEFSLKKGKVLSVIDIGSESHLPEERFLDCLQSFAACMHFAFERPRYTSSVTERGQMHYTTNDLMTIVKSFTKRGRDVENAKIDQTNVADDIDIGTGGKRFQALRPVQEETEGSEDDDSKSGGSQMTELPQTISKPSGSIKPSKRSRFQ